MLVRSVTGPSFPQSPAQASHQALVIPGSTSFHTSPIPGPGPPHTVSPLSLRTPFTQAEASIRGTRIPVLPLTICTTWEKPPLPPQPQWQMAWQELEPVFAKCLAQTRSWWILSVTTITISSHDTFQVPTPVEPPVGNTSQKSSHLSPGSSKKAAWPSPPRFR